MKRAVITVPTVASAWYPHAMIVPTAITAIMKKEAIKGIRTILYTPTQTREEKIVERGEIRVVNPR